MTQAPELRATALMRSLLFVPGHRARMVERALASAADVVLLDLEDGVPPAEKDAARRGVAETVASAAGRPARWVRVHRPDGDAIAADLQAVVRTRCDGLLVSKVERPEQVAEVDRAVGSLERERAVGERTVRFIAAIESARGLLAAPGIAAASPRLVALMFGAEDYANDLGLPVEREAEGSELLYARSAIVNAAAAARIGAIDSVWPDVRDQEGLRRDALVARRLGYAGKSLIHPDQIAVVNEIFSPRAEEVDYARRVLAAFESAGREGRGATALDGKLVDAPVVERARRVVAWEAAIAARRS
jgi:citrate lyase subunit beta/citryl-CoA lyase